MNEASCPCSWLHPILELPDGAFTGLGTLVEHGQTVSIDLRQNEAEWLGIRARKGVSPDVV